MKKRYVALVHGWPAKDRGTINAEISRDAVRRVRMTTRGSGGRSAITHYEVRERIASPFGKFALVDVRIETGRTHQIRVHMSSIGHPVVGDSLYRAPKELRRPTALPRASTKAHLAPQTKPKVRRRPACSVSVATSYMRQPSSSPILEPVSRFRSVLHCRRN